jgi:hypothetical protein
MEMDIQTRVADFRTRILRQSMTAMKGCAISKRLTS